MSLATCYRLGPYHILSPPGASGFGEVYKARDAQPDLAVGDQDSARPVADDPSLSDGFEHVASCTGHYLGDRQAQRIATAESR